MAPKRRKSTNPKGNSTKRSKTDVGSENVTSVSVEEQVTVLQSVDTFPSEDLELTAVESTGNQEIECKVYDAESEDAAKEENSQEFDDIEGAGDTSQVAEEFASVNAAEAEETKQSSNAISKSMKILSDNFEKVKKDLIQIREYVDHWKKQFDLAKREHSSMILKNDSAPQ